MGRVNHHAFTALSATSQQTLNGRHISHPQTNTLTVSTNGYHGTPWYDEEPKQKSTGGSLAAKAFARHTDDPGSIPQKGNL